MGEFNNIHLDLITYSPIFDEKTMLDLYTDNINKNLRKNCSFLLSEITKNKQKKKLNDIFCGNKY